MEMKVVMEMMVGTLFYNFHVNKSCLKERLFRISCYNHVREIQHVTEKFVEDFMFCYGGVRRGKI